MLRLLSTFFILMALLSHPGPAFGQNDRDEIFEKALEARGIVAEPILHVDQATRLVTKGYEFKLKDGPFNPAAQGFVFMHGWHSNPSSMFFFIESALKAGYRAHAFSWRGHGWGTESPFSGGNRSYVFNSQKGDYMPSKMLQDADIINRIMLKRTGSYISMGHSMGAMVTSAANAMGIWKAEKLILLGGPPHFEHTSKLVLPMMFWDRLRRSIPGLASDQPLQYLLGRVEDQNRPLGKVRKNLLQTIAKQNPGLALGISPIYNDSYKWFLDQYLKTYEWKGQLLESPALFLDGDIESRLQVRGIPEDAEQRARAAGFWHGRITLADHLSETLNPLSTKPTWNLIEKFINEFTPERSGEAYAVRTWNGNISLFREGIGVQAVMCKKTLL